MLSYIYCYFCLLIVTYILGTANPFIYILLLLFTCGTHIFGTANAFIYILLLLFTCGTHIFGTANAFTYILLLLFTDWYAHTW